MKDLMTLKLFESNGDVNAYMFSIYQQNFAPFADTRRKVSRAIHWPTKVGG